MSDEAINALDRLQEAVADDDANRALTELGNLRDVYKELAVAERPRIERAKKLARETAGDEPETLQTFVDEMFALQTNRGGALMALGMALVYPEQTNEDPVALAETLKQRETAVQDATAAVSDQLDDVSLPALLFIPRVESPETPVAKGATAEVLAQIVNVGDDPAAGLTATVEASDELAIVDTSGIDAGLSSGQSTTLSATVRAEAVGDATVTVEVTGDNVREGTETAVLEVLAKAGFIDRAQNHLDQLSSRVDRSTPPSGGQEQQLLAKLDAADQQLSRAGTYVDESKEKQASNRLNTASKQLGAFINALEARGNNQGRGNGDNLLPESHRISLIESASDTIELIGAARGADI